MTGTNTGANTFGIPLTDQVTSTANTSVVKSGIGTWVIMNNANTYSGGTAVNAGILFGNSISNVSPGLGTIVTVNSGGTLQPGTPTTPGTLTIPTVATPLVMRQTGAFNFRLVAAPGGANDQIACTAGPANFVATNAINLSGGNGFPQAGNVYTLVTTTGANTTVPSIGSNTTGLNATLAKTATALTVTFTAGTSYTWTGTTSTSTTVTTNWSPAGVPGVNDTITIPTVTNQPALAAAMSVQGVTFSTATGGATLSGAFALTVGGKGITSANTSGTNTLSCNNVTLSAAQTWLVATGGTLAFNNTIVTGQIISTAIQPITFGNATNLGTATFTGGTFTATALLGGFIINGGIVASKSSSGGRTPLGSGPVIVNNGGTLRSDVGDGFGSGALGLTSITINNGGTMTTGTGATRTTLNGTINLNGGTISGAAPGDTNSTGAFSLNTTNPVVINVNNSSGFVSTISTKIGMGTAGTLNIAGGTPGGLDLDMSAGSFVIYTTVNAALIKNGAGVMKLGPSAAGFPGAVTINSGSIIATGATSFNNNNSLTVAAGATFDMNGNSQTIDFLAGGGTVNSSSGGAVTLSLGNASPPAANVLPQQRHLHRAHPEYRRKRLHQRGQKGSRFARHHTLDAQHVHGHDQHPGRHGDRQWEHPERRQRAAGQFVDSHSAGRHQRREQFFPGFRQRIGGEPCHYRSQVPATRASTEFRSTAL